MTQLARCLVPLLLAGLWSNSASAQTKIPPVKFSDTRLSNGLRVIIAEDHYAPVFAIAVSYEVGSKDERAGRTGFAHLFEHMMFKGSENVGSGEHFFLIFNYGGNMNGTTNTDRTVYYEVLPKNQLDLGLFLESDRMRSLAITKDNLDNQRNAVQEERRLRLDDQPYGKAQERFDELAFDNFAYHHSVIGSMTDLDAASVSDVQAFFRTYYAPNNAVLALVGDLDTKATLAKVEKYFSSIPKQEAPQRVDLTEPEMKGERRETVDDKLARLAQLTIAYKIPPATSADAPPLSALGQILGGGESSRLYQKLVKEKQLCSSIGSGAASRMGAGLFRITCTVRPGQKIEEAESLISEEIAKLHSAPVTDKELKRVRTSARRSAVAVRESALSRAMSLADNAANYNDPSRINTLTDKMTAVTAADVERVTKAYLRNDNRVVMYTLPAAAKPKAQ
ncbi:MAG TPA: pitrilysin family protein [Bryobacteraceae bacterium]|jgi:predicted Zn-dependent peptidase|nr:pitrilysin family protein [Bryobacteraceae bacterium]